MMRLGEIKQVRFFSLFLLLSASVTAAAQQGKVQKYRFTNDLQSPGVVNNEHSLIINYSVPEADLENIFIENDAYYRVLIPGHTPTTDIGKPELPVLSRIITVPEDYSYKIRISDVKKEQVIPSAKNIKGLLYPAQESETKNQSVKKPFVIDKNLYKSRGFIARDTVSITFLGKLRKFNLANLVISPARYNPHSNVIEIITSMKIEITFSGQMSPAKSQYPESKLFVDPLSKSVLNFDQTDLVTGYSDKPVRMIVLTDSTYLKTLKPFIKWKMQKGFKLDILTVSPASAGTTFTQIKNKLASIYNSSTEENPPPEFLLIAGDVSKVPYYGNGNVTDMYYGEFTGNGDYIPEMYVGRIPAADSLELKNAIRKIIQYEKFEFADTNKFHSSALTTAGYDDSRASYMNGQVRYAVENYLTSANRINEKHFYYPSSYTAKDTIIGLINKGISFINYSGHGDAEGWQHINNGGTNPVYGIKIGDIGALSNRNMYPFIISNACRTAQFSINQSFGNRMVLSTDKGAIGFIGCSNDSYWDEDYYWSVGLGTISANPVYAGKGLGALDRLFHTHNEAPSDWYTAMGQIVHAGNFAVSASTSSYKKYYWETYNLVGDPSIIPIIGSPIPFNVTLPDTLPNGITTLSLNIEPFSYIAVSHGETLWDASYANPSGSVILSIPAVSDDSCLVVITGQNRKPLFKTIRFSKMPGRYLNVKGTLINDSTGNNNQQADYGETLYVGFNLSNLGLTGAGDVSAILSTTSKWVTMNGDSVFVGNLAPNSDTTINNAFSVTISNTVPDMGTITFNLLVKDAFSEKIYSFDIHAHAPTLEIISLKIDDSAGNNDFIADPGEALNMVFKVRNSGSSNASGNFLVTSTDTNIIILEPNIKSGVLKFDEISQITIPVKLSEDMTIGTIINLLSSLQCDSLSVIRSFSFRVGKLRETFESSSFKVFPWINVGSSPWIITGTNPYEGAVSARSGTIPDHGSSTLLMRTVFSSPDSVRFYYKVSSELSYDFFTFKLNGVEIFKESGESGWKKKVIPVPAGANDMEWVYRKDESKTGGADAAWIDLIDFSVAGSLKYIQKDLKVARIVSPFQSDKMGRENVSVRVLNTGHDTINGFFLAYTYNNRLPVKQFFQNTIFPYSDSVSVTFNNQADLSKYGPYDITVYGYGNSDDYLANDTLKISIENTEIDEPMLAFPNPFNDHLNIVINAQVADDVVLTLTDLKGSKLYSSEKKLIPGDNTFILESEITGLPSGLYYLNIRGRTIKISIHVLKMKL